MRTNDILISDSLVSYTKVLNDLGLVIWNYMFTSDTAYNYQLEFMILCIPTCIRIKQCWFEYRSTARDSIVKFDKVFYRVWPLLVNVLIKRTLLRATDDEKSSGALLLKLNRLNNWWYLALAFNSIYSFIWDIKMDWNLELFNGLFELKNPSSISHPSTTVGVS
ncbi:Protein ERD1 1 [Candida viswanathii]|uniref:Protein ERD1 1 n=1 Tax=Candida viswanathii TaxID=5486 RepID=A0A367XPW4_9ASCO|nr:Protein ERD1 1 [Candida viswanathii]